MHVRLFYFFGKKIMICINYNLRLLRFSITKKFRGVMSIMHLWCEEYYAFHHTSRFFCD